MTTAVPTSVPVRHAHSAETVPSPLSGWPVLIVQWNTGWWYARINQRLNAGHETREGALDAVLAMEQKGRDGRA